MSDITTLLVIEQKSMISKQLEQKLNRKRNIIFRVNNTSAAMEWLKSVDFDIMVVDIYSEWNDYKDYQILRSIRWMSPRIKIILLVTKEKAKQIKYSEELENLNLIRRPYKNEELITSVNHLIENSSIGFSNTPQVYHV